MESQYLNNGEQLERKSTMLTINDIDYELETCDREFAQSQLSNWDNGVLELREFEGNQWWTILDDGEPSWACIAREHLHG